MPDTTPLASDMSQRLLLAKDAPPPPANWLTGQRGDERAAIAEDRAAGRPRRPVIDDLGLEHRWRLAWADRLLEMNAE